MFSLRRASFLLNSVLFFIAAAPVGLGQQPLPGGSEATALRAVPVVDGSYRLSPHEVVKVTVFQEDDLNATARIGEDGTIQLPLIGSVGIGGKTVRQAASAIEAALRQDYLVNPQVSVTVAEFAKRRFAILGQVQRPGTYEIPANESPDVVQAIALAGGYTRSANPSKILIKRVEQGSERVYRINGKDQARSGSEKAFRILPGDTITVGESIF